MKKINILLLLIIVISCGGNADSKKNKFEYKAIEKKEEDSNKNSKETVIIINSNDMMKFDQNELRVFEGQKITLTLNHTGKMSKEIMGHNFVLLKKKTNLNDFAQRAMLARENEYIPKGDETIAYTKMIGGGESDTITFTAPEKGSYTYICTFPGHYGLMKGVLIVN
ncbi:MAG: azurin [Flavobacteriaceae bacterium]|tara:strand:- start:153 stop:653 length:501 start_codon:yes stop_codon:yes gene_type:complete